MSSAHPADHKQLALPFLRLLLGTDGFWLPCRRLNQLGSPFLRLPDTLLHLISRKMGKRSRLLCSKLLEVYGSPGAVVTLPCPLPEALTTSLISALCYQPRHDTPLCSFKNYFFGPYSVILHSWQHPVRRLVLEQGLVLDNRDCHTIATALPTLRELECWAVRPSELPGTAPRNTLARPPIGQASAGTASSSALLSLQGRQASTHDSIHICPHTTLTSLQVHALSSPNLHGIADFAPHLRSLRVEAPNQKEYLRCDPTLQQDGPLASLRALQHLHLLVEGACLSASALPSALQQLTALTHLGLHLEEASAAATIPEADARSFVGALAALPLLATVRLVRFRQLGPTLGAALQALRLRRLELHAQDSEGVREQDLSAEDLAVLRGCFPDIGAMPHLEHLTLAGELATCPTALVQVFRGSVNTTVTSLELRHMLQFVAHPDAVSHSLDAMLSYLPSLTSLQLQLRWARNHEQSQVLLAEVLAGRTQLQHLQLWWGLSSFKLPMLPQLTALELCNQTSLEGLSSVTAQAIGSLCRLRKLTIGNTRGSHEEESFWERHFGWLEAVRKLPLLEELRLLKGTAWTEAEVEALVPPPERLVRVVFGCETLHSYTLTLSQGLQALAQLESYGVDVAVADMTLSML